jgi:hypothetical protein
MHRTILMVTGIAALLFAWFVPINSPLPTVLPPNVAIAIVGVILTLVPWLHRAPRQKGFG